MNNDQEKEIETPKEGVGGLVGIVIIILVLLAGAFYFYNQRLLTIKKVQTAASATATDQFLQGVLNDLNSTSSTYTQGNLNSLDKTLSK